MFPRARTRHKDGKQHRYWSVVESRRVRGGRVVQRHLLHLGELNDSQRAGWVRTIHTLTNGPEPSRQLALFPDDLDTLPELNCQAVRVCVDRMRLARRTTSRDRPWPDLAGAASLELGTFDERRGRLAPLSRHRDNGPSGPASPVPNGCEASSSSEPRAVLKHRATRNQPTTLNQPITLNQP